MVAKTITVDLQDGNQRSLMIVDQLHLDKWLEKKLNVQSLIDNRSVEIDQFDFLEDGGKYTLGPPQQEKLSHHNTVIDPERESLRKRMLALEMQDSRAVSYADYFKEKNERGRIQGWIPRMPNDTQLPLPLRQPEKGGEKSTVKPFWQRIVREHKIVSKFSNGYEVGYLGLKIPDVAFYPCTVASPQAGEFVGFGDCKGNGWTGTSSTEKGQLMLYGHRILDAQPQRSHVYGFITNNDRVVLIRASRSDEPPFGVFWGISAVMTFEDGMKLFFHLLEHDHGFVAPPTVAGAPLMIRNPLRPGGTCRAFAARYKERDAVAKLFMAPAPAQENADKINRAKQAIGDSSTELSAQIPIVEALEGEWLVISPLGSRFSAMTFKLQHVKMLLETLTIIHRANIIHRDVRFANMFLLPNGGVLLNDWGASTVGGSLQLVEGCPPPFCHPDLVSTQEAVPQPKHDLYSLVVSAAHLLLPGLSEQGHQRTLAKAFDAADRGDHNGVWLGFLEAKIKET